MDRSDLINRFKKLDENVLYKNSFQRDGELSTRFYKFTNEHIIGPFYHPFYFTIDDEQYRKAEEFISSGSRDEITEFSEEIIGLVKLGCKPGMPYVILEGDERILVEEILNEKNKGIDVRRWEDLSSHDLEYWNDIMDYLELAKSQRQE